MALYKTIVTERKNRHHHYSAILYLHTRLGKAVSSYVNMMCNMHDIKDTWKLAAVLLFSKCQQNCAISYTYCKQNVAKKTSFSRWLGLKKNNFSIKINGLYATSRDAKFTKIKNLLESNLLKRNGFARFHVGNDKAIFFFIW